MGRIIRKLEQSRCIFSKRKRVAAYTRVSSGKEAMLHSLSAQVSYYSELIQNNPQWEYAGVYIDKAMTGTNDSRAEFQRMIADCKAGKIDMIITKSISRFARNTVTMLQIVRELKAIGVDVFFEKENILFPKSRKTFLGEDQLRSGVNFANKQNQLADDGATRQCNAKSRRRKNAKHRT